jgi:hypothetical protein
MEGVKSARAMNPSRSGNKPCSMSEEQAKSMAASSMFQFRGMLLFLFACALAAGVPRSTGSKVCDVSMYEPRQNSDEYWTAAIQAAIDACQPKGTVAITHPGTYLSGALTVTGSITFHLGKGVTLLAATDRAQYPGGQDQWYLLAFRNCSACKLDGPGLLDGQARAFVVNAQPDRKVVLMSGCRQ